MMKNFRMFELSAVLRIMALPEVKAKFGLVPTCFGVAKCCKEPCISRKTWIINQHNNLGYFHVKWSFCLLFKHLVCCWNVINVLAPSLLTTSKS